MTIEAAVRQVGLFHDVGDADATKSLGAKQRARRVDDAFVVRGGFFPAYLHRAIPLIAVEPRLTAQSSHAPAKRRLTIYMMIVINKQQT